MKIFNVAVLFVDFPDGRINGTDQPYYTYQLSQINDTDAAAEVGTNVIGVDTVPVCSKYTYFDRWDMYFDSLGNFNSTAHPDWGSHKDSAWGSFKEYWNEASNNKVRIRPALIRESATGDSRFKTGIINYFTEIETGRYIIKSIRLNKNKYQSANNTNGYFSGYPYTTGQGGAYINIGEDALNILDTMRNNNPNEYPFDHRAFMQSGGKIIVVFAGGGLGVAGATYYNSSFMVVRGRGHPLVNMQDLLDPNINLLKSSRMDGIAVSCHEFGHNAFGWGHTYASRYDIMCGNLDRQLNCPALPNPVYRMKQGWLQPIAIENSQQLTNLTPIENSYKCGVVTIFGKPSAAPDWAAGESYVIENRQMLKFDRKIVDTLFFNGNPEYRTFNGGLLVWHYSPYNRITNTNIGTDPKIRLKTPRPEDTLIGDNLLGDVRHFFAFLPNQISLYENFLQNRSYSGGGLQTGIEFNNISQNDTNISLNINYTIAPPTNYDGVIYFRDYNRHFINYSGNVYYHEVDTAGFFNFEPGTIIENPGGNLNQRIVFNTVEAKGNENSPIKFTGVGYTSEKSKIPKLEFNKLSTFSNIDSLILHHIKLENLTTSNYLLIFGSGLGSVNPTPLDLKQIEIEENNSPNEILILNSTISKIQLEGNSIKIQNRNNFNGDLILENGRLNFNNSNCSFRNNFGINSINTIITGNLDTFNVQSGNTNWNGFALNGGLINLQSSIIKNALTGIDITGATGEINIRNTKFENNRDYDIYIYKLDLESGDIPKISKNTFIQSGISNVKTASLMIDECPSINVDSNVFANTGYFGIILMNSASPIINFNTITGGNINGTNSNGIFSYNSNGYIKCNNITQCMDYGILLDNSQPVIFNNEVAVNGIGLYLANNSNPIMMPGYMNNETFVLGGYNYIHHNASQEIYCNNTKFSSSIPMMYKGYNAIVDSTPSMSDILIYNTEVGGTAPTIDCPKNYWGGQSPSGRLFPDYSFLYADYLTQRFSYACEFLSEPTENESEPSEYLLLGNVLKNQQQGNYDLALNYSNQLLALSNSEINPILSLNNLFTSTKLSNGNFDNLNNYYINQISVNPHDSITNHKLLNLSIESKIELNELETAISEYDEIINTNSDENVIFYASIDRSRVIRLLLDSLLNHYQGDNPGQDINALYSNAINYQINPNSKSHAKNERKQNYRDTETKSIRDNSFAALKKSITERISNFDNLDQRERRNLILEKNILDLAINNYVDGIASINDKLQFLNQHNTEIPKTYKLQQNYPNPFNPSTKIKYEIPNSEIVKIRIYDLLGREVSTLVNEFKESGSYEAVFNGSNFSSGIYFYKLEAGNFIQVKRMVLVK